MGKHGVALQKEKFLEAYAKAGTVLHACKESGIKRRTFYNWLKKDRAFLASYNQAQEEVVELLEREALRRASEGTLEPVYHAGKPVGAIRKYSDVLLIFLLNAARPEKYRPNQKENGEGGNVTIIVQQFTQSIPSTPKVIIEKKGIEGDHGST